MNENQKELLDVYDSLRQVDNRLIELISSLEEELPLGQEFDLNDPDTYLKLFKRSRSAFSSLSYSICYSKSNLRNKKRKLVSITLPPSPETKSEIITLVLLAFFMMSYWTVKIVDNYRVIDHFCKTFLEKQK